MALIDLVDAKAGSEGGWVDAESALSQQGGYWIYDANSMAFIGVNIRDDTCSTGSCMANHKAAIGGRACIHTSRISHHAQISDDVTINHSLVRGCCRLTDEARLPSHCQMIAARGLTVDRDRVLQIYQRATASASRILHQAQVYDDAFVEHVFVEYYAEAFNQAKLEGNEENGVRVCDNTRVYGYTQLIVGRGEDAIPTVRYSSQVAENIMIEGSCLLRHRAVVGDEAQLHDGSILLDDDMLIQGRTVIIGDVIVEHQVSINNEVQVTAQEGEAIHLRGPKMPDGQQHITRTPLLGAL